jgi:hypothetical protein
LAQPLAADLLKPFDSLESKKNLDTKNRNTRTDKKTKHHGNPFNIFNNTDTYNY